MECAPHRCERAANVAGFSFQSLRSMKRDGSSAGLSFDRTGRMKTDMPRSAQRRHAERTVGISVGEREDPRRKANSTLLASMYTAAVCPRSSSANASTAYTTASISCAVMWRARSSGPK